MGVGYNADLLVQGSTPCVGRCPADGSEDSAADVVDVVVLHGHTAGAAMFTGLIDPLLQVGGVTDPVCWLGSLCWRGNVHGPH